MDPFVATHPIFDRLTKVYGYELAFRSGFEAYFRSAVSGRAKGEARQVFSFDDLLGPARAYVVFPPKLLMADPMLLAPPETLTIGVPADTSADEKVLGGCKRFKDAGCHIGIEGFRMDHLDSRFLDFADVVRVDSVNATADEQKTICEELPSRGIRPLARGVDTGEAFDTASEAGYWYFQGDFFRQPVLRPGKEVSANKLTFLQVLDKVNQPELAYDDLEALIKQDVSMTYRLLRFLNSAWFGLRHTVSSIRQALVLLGPAEVRIWASMLVLSDMGQDKPNELFRRSLIRAKALEALANVIKMERQKSHLFLVGMFSLVEALTDIPIARVLDGLPLNENVKDALLGKPCPLRTVLEAIEQYEMGKWKAFSQSAGSLGLDEYVMPTVFRAASKWADDALSAI
ncbi:MAG TPA: HDOD domain-containing protein [Phycisphaerae bacterium]|nr:HDOD domain-containing protein [Phycisphaerae bacterium]